MLKRLIPILMALAVLLAACGPQATPTMNPADVQGTAVAAAWTMVAETQAAIPTATPLPPTPTPSPTSLPTFTPLPQPTSGTPAAVLPTATLASASGGTTDNCLMPLPVGEAGPTVPIRIENQSGGTIRVSINMYEENAFGQCGAISTGDIPRNGDAVYNLPKGLYWAYAWITYGGGQSGTASGSFELRPSDNDKMNLVVGQEVIVLKP